MNFEHSNKWFIKLLRFGCPSQLYEEIEGDLIQRFHRDLRQYGEKTARRRMLWNSLRFFRPGIMMRNKFVFDMNGLSMFKNHWDVAGRNLLRNKAFSIINILGLSISMAVSLLIFQYVKFELSYDRFHQTSEKIYRVTTAVSLQKEVINHEANTYEGIAQALKTDFPEVNAATTIYGFNSDKTFVRYENEDKELTALQTFKAFEVDSSFFHVFSFPLKTGDPSSVLDEPFSSVISEELENQYFSGNAIGKILETKDGSQSVRYKITGILRNVPANSHFKFDLLIRSANRDKTFWNGDISFWDWSGQTYIKLNNAADTASLKPKLNALASANNGLKRDKDDYGQVSTFALQPLASIHLYSHLTE
jgi:putative ABC transport system permease protein